MSRDEAIRILITHRIAELTPMERINLLMDWWAIDSYDSEYAKLPDALKIELTQTDHPNNPEDSKYNPLICVALQDCYIGVLNSYLENQLSFLGRTERVIGCIEQLEVCFCCGYRSLKPPGAFEICRVCFWEQDGTTELDRISPANHITLRQARLNIQRFGAITMAASRHVLTDGRARYASAF